MFLLVPFLGLTNGYLTVCAPVVAPKGYMVITTRPFLISYEKIHLLLDRPIYLMY